MVEVGKIEMGGFEVLEAGTIIVPQDQWIQFSFDELKFRMFFYKNPEPGTETKDNELRYKFEVKEAEDQKILYMYFYNTKGSLFSNIKEPLNIATIKGKKLSFIFSMTSLLNDDTNNLFFSYTWLLEK